MRVNHFPSSSRSAAERRKRCMSENYSNGMQGDYFEYGYNYFDNRDLGAGYGGYVYDGRWAEPVAGICAYYGLKPGARVLEVGCAKGFVLVEFAKLGCEVRGIDASPYAVANAHPDIADRIALGDATDLPFEDGFFDFVFSKDTFPHIPEDRVSGAVRELTRVSKGAVFLDIQCGNTDLELEFLRRWDGTHKTIRPVSWWDAMLASVGYAGDVNYKILIPEAD